MEGIFLEYENENALRAYPFASGCVPSEGEAEIGAGVFVDAMLYPVNPSGALYLSEVSDKGVFSISDDTGVIMTGSPAGSSVDFHDLSGLDRHVGTLVASSEDMENALKWYFKHHHKKNRPFIFIGEGEGGRLLKAYEQNNAEDLKKKGLVASFYCDEHQRGFVTKAMVEEIKEAIARARFKNIWGKDMPSDMLSK